MRFPACWRRFFFSWQSRFFVIALVLMVIPYDIQRKLENFDAYKAEFEKQWGVVEESDVRASVGRGTPT
jgi:hypothetical protein